MKHVILTIGTSVLLMSCASTKTVQVLPNDPNFAPIMPEAQDELVVPTGSLFRPNYVNNIYSDAKAHRVGDIISVILSESTQANKNANTEVTKETNHSLEPLIGLAGNPITFGGRSLQFEFDQENDFAGDASANQSNSLDGNISVHVLRVLPNGNLMIRGEKWMTLNNGNEYIRLNGMIRAQDIGADNTVLSSRVANARIQYSGTGEFADVQEQGWLSAFFSSSWWPI